MCIAFILLERISLASKDTGRVPPRVSSTETTGLLFASENSGNPITRLLLLVWCVWHEGLNAITSSPFGLFVLVWFHRRDWITGRTRRTVKLEATLPTMVRATLRTVTVASPVQLHFQACLQPDYPVSAFPTQPALLLSAIIFPPLISPRQDLINSCRTPVWHRHPPHSQVRLNYSNHTILAAIIHKSFNLWNRESNLSSSRKQQSAADNQKRFDANEQFATEQRNNSRR